MIGIGRLLIGEVRIIVGEAILLLPTALPRRKSTAIRSGGGLDLGHRAGELRIVVKIGVAVPAVVGEIALVPHIRIRIQATVLMLGVGIAMQRVVGQPGELLVWDLVLEHIAHGFDRQSVEELLLEAISAVRAKDLDHVVAHERIGYETRVARPQARATRNVERGGDHHAQKDVGVDTSQIPTIGLTQIAQNTEGLDVVSRKRRSVPPICMNLAAQDVMTQRGKIAHQPVDELGIGRILLAKLAELLLARAVDELPLQK